MVHNPLNVPWCIPLFSLTSYAEKSVKLTTLVCCLPVIIGHIFTEPATPYSFLHDETSATSVTFSLYSVHPFELQIYFQLSISTTTEVVNMPNQAPRHEGIEASGCTVIQTLPLGICLRRLVNFNLQRFYSWYSFSRRLGGPRRRSRDFKEERNLFPWSGIDPWSLGLVVLSLVTIQSHHGFSALTSRSQRNLIFVNDFNLLAPWMCPLRTLFAPSLLQTHNYTKAVTIITN